jgi:dolichol-phosphate mannosyltransferase
MSSNSLSCLSLIIPCYNEAEGLPYLKANLDLLKDQFPIPIEFIFVDDGSRDQTYNLLLKLFESYPQKIFVRNEKNLDLGGAIKRGIAVASGDFIATLDADCSYDPLCLIGMLAKLQDGYDVVSASAHHPQAGFVGDIPAYRLLLSKGVVLMYNCILWRHFFSYTSMYRLYRSSILKNLEIKSNTFMAMAEIIIKLILQDKKVLDYPAQNRFRKYGTSKARIVRIIKAHLILMSQLICQRIFPWRQWL